MSMVLSGNSGFLHDIAEILLKVALNTINLTRSEDYTQNYRKYYHISAGSGQMIMCQIFFSYINKHFFLSIYHDALQMISIFPDYLRNLVNRLSAQLISGLL